MYTCSIINSIESIIAVKKDNLDVVNRQQIDKYIVSSHKSSCHIKNIFHLYVDFIVFILF